MVIALELFAILLLLIANGAFAMSEIAVVTARSTRLDARAERGDQRARAAAELKDEPTEFLSAVQIGISLVGILAGAFGGARIAGRLAVPLSRLEWLAPYADIISFVLVVGAVTYLSLVIGELVPKQIALSDPEKVASVVARPMQRLATLARPLVALLTASTNAVSRLLGVAPPGEPEVTEQDIRALIAQGARAGVLHETEEDILERVFYVGDRQVRAVMTPRPDVDWIETTAAVADVRQAMSARSHSRLLVCEGDIDHVRGVVRASDLLNQCLDGMPLDLEPLLRHPHFVPMSMPVLQLLQRFGQSEVQMAIALDEFGSVQGVITLDDILRDLVADVPGLAAGRAADVVRRDDGSWLVDGTVQIEDVEHAIGDKLLPVRRARGSRTLGGLILERLGRVPAVGESVDLDRWRLEVVDLDGRRVDRILVEPLATPTDESEPGLQ
ncbi:MAG TPA: hemolysin family protein [Gemmatimonadaceae bacterium]|nr:hemolysin family protein [Gemmatimonadaceae bacterium]